MVSFKLDRLVREFMAEDLGLEQIDRRYPRFLSMAISALRDLRYDNIGGYEKEVVLDVNDNDTVDLPLDYIDYYAIGVCSNGELSGLGVNTNLCDVAKDDCGNRTEDTQVLESDTMGVFSYYTDYNDKGEHLGGNFGVGGGRSNIGQYKIYPDKGYIALQGYTGSQIILRYKADIQSVNGDYEVHPYDVQPIKDWIWYKYVSKSRSSNLGTIQLAERAYAKSKKQAQKRHSSFSVREFLNAYRSGFRGSPRV